MLYLFFKEVLDVSLCSTDELRKVQNSYIRQLFNNLSILKPWNIYKRTSVQPLTLDNHLDYVNEIHSAAQEPFVRTDVYHSLDDTDSLVKHRFGICDVVSDWKWTSFEMRLQKEIGFNMRRF